MNKMHKHKWNKHMVAVLTELYPVETTPHVAATLNMSETSVKKKARKLGLSKIHKSKWMERADYIRNHYQDRSYAEMARDLGMSKSSVFRIVDKLGLKRSKEENFKITSRVRKEIIRRERRHVIFGLQPVTKIKVVSNRARVRLRSRMKSYGYIVSQMKDTLYFVDDIRRRHKLEERGVKLGLRFIQVPEESLTKEE